MNVQQFTSCWVKGVNSCRLLTTVNTRNAPTDSSLLQSLRHRLQPTRQIRIRLVPCPIIQLLNRRRGVNHSHRTLHRLLCRPPRLLRAFRALSWVEVPKLAPEETRVRVEEDGSMEDFGATVVVVPALDDEVFAVGVFDAHVFGDLFARPEHGLNALYVRVKSAPDRREARRVSWDD